MKALATMILFCALVSAANAQKINIYKTFGGVMFMQNDSIELSTKQVSMVLHRNQEAYEKFKKARTRSRIASILGFGGAAAITAPLVTLAFGEQPNWAFAGGGTAGVVGAFFFERWYKARAIDAIDTYNEALPQKTSRIKTDFHFYGTGATLVIKF